MPDLTVACQHTGFYYLNGVKFEKDLWQKVLTGKMSLKEKILDTLGCALDDISEDRLLDILLDAYKAKQHRIKELANENAYERDLLERERMRLIQEQQRMRGDPLYNAGGDYFFRYDRQKFRVCVQGNQIELFEQRGNVAWAVQQIDRAEWLK